MSTRADNQTPPAQAPRSAMAQEQVLGKAYDVKLMIRLWRFVAPHWKLLVVSTLLVLIAPAFELAQPYLLGIAVDDYIAPHRTEGLIWLVLGYLGLVALNGGTTYVQLFALQLLGQRAMHDLRTAIYQHVISQRSAFFDRMPVGRLLTRMTNDVENINEMFANGVVTLAADVVKLIAIVVVMLTINVKLTLMTFLVMPLLVVVVNYARVLMRNSFREIRVKLAALSSFAQEHLAGMKVVQLFAREPYAREEYDQINAAHRDAYLDAIRADAVMYALVEAIGVVSIALILWHASGAEDPPTIGVVVAFIEYVRKFFIPIRDFSAKYTVMQSAMAASERIVSLLDDNEPDAPPRAAGAAKDVSDARPESRPEAPPGAAGATGRLPAIRVEDVSFGYRAGDDVLRGVSFDIPHGSVVAVVGATGSGKSTIIKLLARLYEIDRGSIVVDGREIRDLPVADLRRRITVVSQDVFLFAGTVADNVRLGNAGATDEQVHTALHRVGADRMLARRASRSMSEPAARPGGPLVATPGSTGAPAAAAPADPLQIQILERGSNFSAGERQLIAFARALLRDPEILVLDEATAHVDPEAEGLIEQGVAELMRDRTTLVIAHRLSTIRNADQILVMSRGRIVEQGTHDELVARGGVYARLERTFSRKD
jgi:ATP-binding cassette subfamily B multidrug efflux pump